MALTLTGRDVPRPGVSVSAWWALAVLFSLSVISYVDRTVLSVVAESIKRDIGLTDTQMSLILGPAFTFFYAILCVPLGWAADRYPRRWVIFVGTLVWSAGAASSGLAGSFGAMFVSRAGVGVGEAALHPSAYALLADKFPRHRLGLALSFYQAGVYVGVAGAFAAAALLLSNADDVRAMLPFMKNWAEWRMTLVLTAAPGILLALLLFTFTERAHPVASKADALAASPIGIMTFMRENKRMMELMMAGFGLLAMASYVLQAWTPLISSEGLE